MSLELIADSVLSAVQACSPETRYEEKSCTDRGRRFEGTNVVLRRLLDAQPGEVLYPGCGDLCDVVFRTSDDRRVWLEVKQAWTWMTYRNPRGANGYYDEHLFGASASALSDARFKLPRLIGSSDADVMGLLVIALDSTYRPLPVHDMDRLEALAEMGAAPWQRFSRPRWMSSEPGYEPIGIRPFLWLRPTAELSLERASVLAADVDAVRRMS